MNDLQVYLTLTSYFCMVAFRKSRALNLLCLWDSECATSYTDELTTLRNAYSQLNSRFNLSYADKALSLSITQVISCGLKSSCSYFDSIRILLRCVTGTIERDPC